MSITDKELDIAIAEGKSVYTICFTAIGEYFVKSYDDAFVGLVIDDKHSVCTANRANVYATEIAALDHLITVYTKELAYFKNKRAELCAYQKSN